MLTPEQQELVRQYPAPERKDYETQEEFEEAIGGWRSRVGRLLRPLPDFQPRSGSPAAPSK